MTGIVQMQEHAMSSPHRVISLKEPLNIVSPTASVLIESVFVTIKGHIKLFHAATNVKTAKVAIAGIAQGSATLKNVCQVLHPSSFEASSNSEERLRK